MNFFGSKQEPIKKEEANFTVNLAKIEMEVQKSISSKSVDWVLNGAYNTFPQYLIDLKNESAIHSAIIESSTRMLVGTGIQFDLDPIISENIIAGMDPKMKSRLDLLIKDINPNDTLNNIMFNCVRDYKTYGYSFLEVIWNKDHSAPIRINYIDASKIAIGKLNERDEITHFYYCKNWKSTNQNTPARIGIFNPDVKKEYNQLIFFNNKTMGSEYFGTPQYYSGLKWIKCDGAMAATNLNSIENGFSPNVLIKYFSQPTEEQQEKAVSNFKRSMTGVGQKLLFLFWPDKDNAPEVQPLQIENFNDRLVLLNDMIVQQIITAHRIHPTLVGIPSGSKLGVSNELGQAYKIYFETLVKPERDIFQNALTKILNLNNIDLPVYFNTPDMIEVKEVGTKLEITQK